MIDCFVSTLDITPNRMEWSRQAIESFLKEPELNVTILDAGSPPEQLDWFAEKGVTVVPQPKKGSIFRRFLLAEALAQSELYILSDNDLIPYTQYWLAKMLEVGRSHPQFGYIVARMRHCDFSGDSGFEDADVRSIQKGGGLALVRRDARTAPFKVPFIYDPTNADDHCYCEAMRKSGKGVGMFTRIYMEHFGRSESTAGLYK